MDALPTVTYRPGEHDVAEIVELAIAGHPVLTEGRAAEVNLWHAVGRRYGIGRYQTCFRRLTKTTCLVYILRNPSPPPMYDE